jgi:hypothetical protein
MPFTTPIAIAERRSAILAATVAVMAASPSPAWSSVTRVAAQTPGTTVTVNGRVRQLVCRGKTGIALSVLKDPSESDPSGKYVTMQLTYTPAATAPGTDFNGLQPGECSWNPLGLTEEPKEPGRVYFDVQREAQPWSALETRAMDTTAKAGAFHPDPITLPRYLGDPNHYWVFYVDDATHSALSFGAWRETGLPTYVIVSGPIGTTAMSPDTRKELRCRGGGSGLAFTPGGSAGTNLVNMTLGYQVSAKPPGTTGGGLDPGSCAWVDREGMAREPGRVDFITAGNAQLKQIQSGGTVDRTATAAERYPDANTIPVYLSDRNRFWTFTVTVGSPSTARAHAAWKMDIGDVILSGGPGGRSTTRAGTTGTTEPFAKQRKDASPVLNASQVGLTFHEVVRRPNEYWIRFAARSGAKARVWYGTQPPQYTSRPPYPPELNGIPGGTELPVRFMSERGFSSEYSTAPMKNLAQGTKYYFAILLHDSNGTRIDAYAGEFVTMTQTVTVRFSRVRILNDSDKASAGDLSFRFFVAPATEEHANCSPATACTSGFDGRSWETGESHPLGDVLTLSPSPLPGRIRVWVKGWDDDSPSDTGVPISPGGLGYFGTGGSGSYADWNFARREFDTGASPTQTRIGYPFRLRSIDGSVFMFEVEGHVEVVRQ